MSIDLLPAINTSDASRVRTTRKLLPALGYHVERFPCPPISLVLITHILDTAVPFIEAVSSTVRLETILGIPYSTMPGAHAALLQNGERVSIPRDISSLPSLARAEILDVSRRNSTGQVVVQEIGGYCEGLVDELVAAGALGGVVEDTKQGHWKYASRDSLPCPVFTIADSPLKDLENQQVGRAISHALETILRRGFHRLMPETQVGVIGYGGIGEATARALSALGSRVAAFDVCGIRMAKAALDGFGHLTRDELMATSDVIVGVSGECSITASDFELLRPGAFVASGSSKQVEIDLATLNDRAALIENDGIVKEYELDGKPIILLNDGMPVNFLEQSVLGRVLDLVYTELYMCIRQLAVEEIEPGLARLPVNLQREIAGVWRELHWR